MAEIDLADLRKQCITSLYLCTENLTKYLDEEKENEFLKLKSIVENYCVLEARQNLAMEALEKAKNETDASNIDSLDRRFEEYLSTMTDSQVNLNNHPFVTELNRRYENGLERNTRQEYGNLEESDVAITQSTEQYIDPITKRPIDDPMRNSLCGHIYEKSSIVDFISKSKHTKCPVVGCGNRNPVLMKHLIYDEELKFRLTLTQHSTMIQDGSIMDTDSY